MVHMSLTPLPHYQAVVQQQDFVHADKAVLHQHDMLGMSGAWPAGMAHARSQICRSG